MVQIFGQIGKTRLVQVGGEGAASTSAANITKEFALRMKCFTQCRGLRAVHLASARAPSGKASLGIPQAGPPFADDVRPRFLGHRFEPYAAASTEGCRFWRNCPGVRRSISDVVL
jgi:hypothetical protein